MKRKWIVAVLAAALLALPHIGRNLAQVCDQLNPKINYPGRPSTFSAFPSL
jgi:hypothetical protein